MQIKINNLPGVYQNSIIDKEPPYEAKYNYRLHLIVYIAFRSILFWPNYTWISIHYGMRRHIAINKTIWGNHYIITDCYFSDNSRINTHPHAISDYGRTISLTPAFLSDCYIFMNVTICSNFYFTIYSNIPRVSYIEPRTYVRTGMNLASIREL